MQPFELPQILVPLCVWDPIWALILAEFERLRVAHFQQEVLLRRTTTRHRDSDKSVILIPAKAIV